MWCKQERLNQVFLGVVLRSNHDCTLVTLRWYHENIGVCTEYTVRIHVLLPQIYRVSFGQVISHYKYAVISQRLWKKVTGNVLLQWLCIKKRQMLLNVGGSFPFCGITINSSSLKIPNKKNKKELRDWETEGRANVRCLQHFIILLKLHLCPSNSSGSRDPCHGNQNHSIASRDLVWVRWSNYKISAESKHRHTGGQRERGGEGGGRKWRKLEALPSPVLHHTRASTHADHY